MLNKKGEISVLLLLIFNNSKAHTEWNATYFVKVLLHLTKNFGILGIRDSVIPRLWDFSYFFLAHSFVN